MNVKTKKNVLIDWVDNDEDEDDDQRFSLKITLIVEC